VHLHLLLKVLMSTAVSLLCRKLIFVGLMLDRLLLQIRPVGLIKTDIRQASILLACRVVWYEDCLAASALLVTDCSNTSGCLSYFKCRPTSASVTVNTMLRPRVERILDAFKIQTQKTKQHRRETARPAVANKLRMLKIFALGLTWFSVSHRTFLGGLAAFLPANSRLSRILWPADGRLSRRLRELSVTDNDIRFVSESNKPRPTC